MSVLFIIVFFVAIIGAPLFTVIGGSSILNFLGENQILVVPQEISGLANMPLLHSIPLFTFAGYILAESNASKRLVKFTRAALGWMPGGLAIVTLIACALFTAFTGASGVTIVALGGFLLPALMLEKYKEKFSLGLVTTSGSLGLLFPPSLPIILFGVIASVSIDKMFVAGIFPGILLLVILSGFAMYKSHKFGIERTKFSFKEIGNALWEIKWELPLPILLIGGIYSGKIAISDSAAFTVAYVLIVEVFLTKDIKIKQLPKIMKESMELVGAILVILAVSLASSNYIIYKQIPEMLFDMFKNIISNKIMFLLLLNLFLVVVGCIMDIFSALVVIVPLILPLAEAYNIDKIHLGIIFLINLQIGYLTPPVGMNLFISSIRFKKPILDIYKSTIPFIVLSFLALFIITYVPAMSIWFLEKPSIIGKWERQLDSGEVDQITIKSGNKYLRSKGDPIMMMMFDTPDVNDYTSTKNSIVLKNRDGDEEYKYEIFSRGKKILLTDKDKNQYFYINKISPPIDEKIGRFITKWKSNDNNIEIEFYLSGLANWAQNGEEELLRYSIENKKLIIYKEIEDREEKIIYKFKFTKNNTALNLFNNTESYDFEISSDINDM